MPYYVTNFEYILGCVLDCTDDRRLFSGPELAQVAAYRRLQLGPRKLFVRLLNRRHAWLLPPSISRWRAAASMAFNFVQI